MELTDKIRETKKMGIKLITAGAITALTALSLVGYDSHREKELNKLMPMEHKLVFGIDDKIENLETVVITDRNKFEKTYDGKRNASIYDLLESVNYDSLLDKIKKIRVLKNERDSLISLDVYKEYEKKWYEFYGGGATMLIMGKALMFCIGAGMIVCGGIKLREAKK